MKYSNYDRTEAELNSLISPTKWVMKEDDSILIGYRKVAISSKVDVSTKTGEMLVSILAQLKSIDKTGSITFKSWYALGASVGMCGNSLKKYCHMLQKYDCVKICKTVTHNVMLLGSMKKAVSLFMDGKLTHNRYLRFYKDANGKLLKFAKVKDRLNCLQDEKLMRYFGNVLYMKNRAANTAARVKEPSRERNLTIVPELKVGISSGHLANKVQQSVYMCRKTVNRLKDIGVISTKVVYAQSLADKYTVLSQQSGDSALFYYSLGTSVTVTDLGLRNIGYLLG